MQQMILSLMPRVPNEGCLAACDPSQVSLAQEA